MRRIWQFACMALLAVLLLTGCAPFTTQNINELLRAPAMGQGIADIQNALKEYLGETPQYKFPKEGELRSPYVMADLDGNGEQEAVLFYTLAGGATTNVYVAVLAQTDGHWKVMQNVEGSASDLASVEVANLFGDNTRQLVVGFSGSTLVTKTLVVYIYEDTALLPTRVGLYSRFILGDFTGTGRNDLAIVSTIEELGGLKLDFLSGAYNEEGAKVFSYQQNSVELVKAMESCEALHPSRGPNGERLLVVDGKTIGSVMISQILYLSGSGEGFYGLGLGEAANFANETGRNSSLLISRDIDNDGMVEIPINWGSASVQANAEQYKLQYIEWVNFFGEEPETKQFGILDASRGIYVRLPESWQQEIRKGRYAVQDGAEQGFWKIGNVYTGEVLLEVRTLATAEIPPGENKRIPGVANMYVFPGSTVNTAQRNQINVVTLM